MSHAYNAHKKQRRHSRPKYGHQLRKGEHVRRLSFREKLMALFELRNHSAVVQRISEVLQGKAGAK